MLEIQFLEKMRSFLAIYSVSIETPRPLPTLSLVLFLQFSLMGGSAKAILDKTPKKMPSISLLCPEFCQVEKYVF
jgi:hypothetical protein